MRTSAFAILLSAMLLILTACGGSSPASAPASGPLTGNWQITMLQQYPGQATTLGVSGFLSQSNDALTGSVEGPSILSTNGQNLNCGGTAQVAGTVSGQNVSFTENIGGTTYNFSGTISSDNQSMSGDFQALAGACFKDPTSGTWDAFLIPPLNGNFTGSLTDSSYMAELLGVSTAPPITVSGSLSQSSNAGGSNASITGTINAVGYPCFSTVSVTGTISGQNVYLDVFSYTGEQIGTLGKAASSIGVAGAPATVVSTSNGLSLVDNTSGDALFLGVNTPGPCAPLNDGGLTVTGDSTNVVFNFQ